MKALVRMLDALLTKAPSSVMDSVPDWVIATDASNWGWGVVIVGGDEVFVECGEWNEWEKDLSINTRELEAIFRGLILCKIKK